MPTSGSATPKPSPCADLPGAIHPVLLAVVLGILYAGIDLARRGPLWQGIRTRIFLSPEAAAIVNGTAITNAQLDLATGIFLATRGHPSGDDAGHRSAVLANLIQAEVIRQAASGADSGPPPSPEWVARGIQSFEDGFAPGKLPALLQEESLDPGTCRKLLADHLAQVHWLDQRAKIDAPDAATWFAAHAAALSDPETVRARHIFLSTVENNGPERETLIRDLHQKLVRQEASFADLALRFSEDERTKRAGGDLGYFSRHRVPSGFAAPVFNLQPGRLSDPFRTSIGWHVVEVTDKIPARPARWPDLRAELELHLANEAKREALHRWWQASAPQPIRIPEISPSKTIRPSTNP